MKTKSLLLLSLLVLNTFASIAYAQDDEMSFPEETESIIPAGASSSTPPVIIDESDSQDVSDVEEYDG